MKIDTTPGRSGFDPTAGARSTSSSIPSSDARPPVGPRGEIRPHRSPVPARNASPSPCDFVDMYGALMGADQLVERVAEDAAPPKHIDVSG
jgi:hypothetical protein